MLIELQEPFSSKWGKGYKVFDNSTGRFRVVFYNDKINISGMSYARYLMCVKLGYILSPEFEVDHIDDDKTNDDIDNLQVLTKEQNRIKQEWLYNILIQQWYIIPCTYCSNLFYITERDLRFRKIETICCSRSCSARLQHNNKH